MPRIGDIRTSLEVGFSGDSLPERLAGYRGKTFRSIKAMREFPFEDSQFDVVMLSGKSVVPDLVKEAHRVLRSSGHLFFIVPEKTKRQDGFVLADVYSIVRYGFNIIGVERTPWWSFARKSPTLFICAEKKSWKTITNNYRPLV